MKLWITLALASMAWGQNIVQVAPFYPVVVGTQALTSNAGTDTSMDVLSSGSMGRTLMPFTGSVYRISIYFADTTDLNDIYFTKNTCSTMAGGLCTVWTPSYTAEIMGPFTANAVNTFTLATPLAVTKWDSMGVRLEWTTPHPTNVAALSAGLFPISGGSGDTTAAETCYSQLNVSKPSAFTISGMTIIPGSGCIPIGVFMVAPPFVGIGDSIMCSVVLPSDCVSDAYAVTWPIPANYSPTHFWADSYLATPSVYESLGWGGQQSGQILTRLPFAISLKPNWMLIGTMVNDIIFCANTGCTPTQISNTEANVASILAANQTAGIKTFIFLAGPWNVAGGSTTALMLNEDTINNYTISIASTYGATVVDWRCVLGQFRAGGSTNNCWDWQSAYIASSGNTLFVHPNQAGAALMGNLVKPLLPYISSGSSASGSSGGLF